MPWCLEPFAEGSGLSLYNGLLCGLPATSTGYFAQVWKHLFFYNALTLVFSFRTLYSFFFKFYTGRERQAWWPLSDMYDRRGECDGGGGRERERLISEIHEKKKTYWISRRGGAKAEGWSAACAVVRLLQVSVSLSCMRDGEGSCCTAKKVDHLWKLLKTFFFFEVDEIVPVVVVFFQCWWKHVSG